MLISKAEKTNQALLKIRLGSGISQLLMQFNNMTCFSEFSLDFSEGYPEQNFEIQSATLSILQEIALVLLYQAQYLS